MAASQQKGQERVTIVVCSTPRGFMSSTTVLEILEDSLRPADLQSTLEYKLS